jgi:nucleotide-binding universal stress UspA family protein
MPPSIKTALVAINDSEAALHAFLEAIALSRRIGLRLLAISVAPAYNGDLSLVGVRSFKRALSEPIATVLEEAVKIAKSERIGLETFRAEGEPAESITALAQSKACDLLIIGQAKRTCWNAWDSLTARLIRDWPRDLLVIPQNKPLQPKRICLVDLESSDHRAARQAEMLARWFGADLCILPGAGLPDRPEPTHHPTEKPRIPASAKSIHGSSRLPQTLTRLIESDGCDMMVLPAKRTSRLWDKVSGGRQLRLLRRAFIPTWLIKL